MRKIFPLFLILFFMQTKGRANCDPTFTVSINQSTVQVQPLNTDPHLLHTWIFGGVWKYGPTSSFTYCQPGTYTISHRVYDSLNNCADSAFQSVVITEQVNWSASFTATRDSLLPYQFHFQNTSNIDAASIIFYWWRIDGTMVSNSPSFNYTLYVGNYNVCLSIMTVGGCILTTCDTMLVLSPPCTLTASFTYATPVHPRQFNFTATPSNVFSYMWVFGDGDESFEQNPTHTYSQPGNYNVILRVYNPPCYDTMIQNITVHGTPADSCTASFMYGISGPGEFEFFPESNQTITSQYWQIFHNGIPYDSMFMNNGNQINYTFMDTGYYWVCVDITTNTGCTKSYCQGIIVDNVGNRQVRTIPSWPNPAQSTVSFHVHLEEAGNIGVTIYNLSGYAVYKMQRNGNSGLNQITIPVQQLNPGQYFLDIQYGNQRKRSIFQKL